MGFTNLMAYFKSSSTFAIRDVFSMTECFDVTSHACMVKLEFGLIWNVALAYMDSALNSCHSLFETNSKSKKLIEITRFNFPRMMQIILWIEVLPRVEFFD